MTNRASGQSRPLSTHTTIRQAKQQSKYSSQHYLGSNQSQKLDIIKYYNDLVSQRDKTINQLKGANQKLNQQLNCFKAIQQQNQIMNKIKLSISQGSSKEAQKYKEEIKKLNQEIQRLKISKIESKKVSNLCRNCTNFYKNIEQNIKLKAQIETKKQLIQIHVSQNQQLNKKLSQFDRKQLQKNNNIQLNINLLRQTIQKLRREDNQKIAEIDRLKNDNLNNKDQYSKQVKQLLNIKQINEQFKGFIKNTYQIFKINLDLQKSINQKQLLKQINLFVENLNSKISLLQKNIAKEQKVSKDIQQALKQAQDQIEKKNISISDYEVIKTTFQAENLGLKKSVNQFKSSLQKLKKQFSDNDAQLKLKINTINSLNMKIQQLQKREKDVVEVNEKQKLQIKNLKENVQGLETKLKQSQTKITEINKTLNSTIQKGKQDLKKIQTSLKNERDGSNKWKSDYQKQKEFSKNTTDNLNKTKKDLEDKKRQFERLKEQNNRQIKKLNDQINNLNLKLSQIQNKYKKLQNQYSKMLEYKQKSQNYELIIQKINNDFISSTFKIITGDKQMLQSARPDRLDQIDREIQHLKLTLNSKFLQAKFFSGTAIVPSLKIQWIFDQIQKFTGNTPFSSRLVYKYDPLNSTNFHKYFDGIRNLALFVKLSHGPIIGGFTIYPVEQKVQKPGKAFIFNLNNEKTYKMRQDPRLPATTYDIYYFILGNAEIRLKSQQKKVFSNFGIANSTFDNGADQRTRFLDVSENTNNQLDIEGYEFYQIQFKG